MPRIKLGRDPANWPRPSINEIDAVCREVASKNSWMGERNAAAIATICLFGKRESEVAMLKGKDLDFDERQVRVRFYILKDHKPPYKICPSCSDKNRAGNNYCKRCGESIEEVPVIRVEPEYWQRELIRPVHYPLVQYISWWHSRLPDGDAFMFPRNNGPSFAGPSQDPDWTEHISGSALYHILERSTKGVSGEDSAWWPHLMRHLLATRQAEAGVDAFGLMQWFGWKRAETANRYVQMGGGRTVIEIGKI